MAWYSFQKIHVHNSFTFLNFIFYVSSFKSCLLSHSNNIVNCYMATQAYKIHSPVASRRSTFPCTTCNKLYIQHAYNATRWREQLATLGKNGTLVCLFCILPTYHRTLYVQTIAWNKNIHRWSILKINLLRSQ